MRLDGEVVAAGRGLPEEHVARAVGRGEQGPVGAERDGLDPVGVTAEIMELRAGLHRPDPRHLLGAAERHEPLVGADVGGEHRVEVVAHGAEPPAGLHVPDGHAAALPSHAPAGDHQAPAAAEPHHVGTAFGEGEHTREVERVGAEEKHLLLAAGRHERRPGARRQRRAGIRGGGTDGRLEREPPGQRRHRRPHAGRRCPRHLHLLRRHGDAALGLEHAAVDPGLEHRPLRLRDRRRVGGHLRLVVVVGNAKESAPRRVARRDHLARAAAPHDAGEARDIEPGGLLVGVVARTAPLPEHGERVVNERDRVLPMGRRDGHEEQACPAAAAATQPAGKEHQDRFSCRLETRTHEDGMHRWLSG